MKNQRKIPQIVKQIQNHKFPEFNWGNEKHISYSQFSMFEGCNHRWALQYKDGHKKFTSSISTVFGTAIHETLQHYLTIMFEKSSVEADEIDLEEMLESKLGEIYRTEYKKNHNQHFSNPEDIREHYEDGIEIIRYIKKNRLKYFSKKDWYLIGCEIPLILNPIENYKTLFFKGFLDLVLYHEPTETIKIIDFKSSRSSWNDSQKRDKTKLSQLILYKQFFSDLYKVDKDKIQIEFVILKRKIWEKSEYQQSRLQSVVPTSGPTVTKKIINNLNNFIETCFEVNGEYKIKDHIANPGKACNYCPFKGNKNFCKY